jgi:hypothetical protein
MLRRSRGYDARVAPVANLGAKDDWSRALPDMLAAINACVAREGTACNPLRRRRRGGADRSRAPDRGQRRRRLHRRRERRGAPAIAPPRPRAGGAALLSCARAAPIVACGRLERVQVRTKDAGYLHYEPC